MRNYTSNFNRVLKGIQHKWNYWYNDSNKTIYKLAYNSGISINTYIIKTDKDEYIWETSPISIAALKEIQNSGERHFMSSDVPRLLESLPKIDKKSFKRLLKNEAIISADGIIYTFNKYNKFSNKPEYRSYSRVYKPQPIKKDSKLKKKQREMERRKNRHWTARLTDEQLKFVQEIHNMEDTGTAKAITGHPSRGKFTLKKKKLNKKYRRSVVKNAKSND